MSKIELSERELTMLSAALADRLRRFRKSEGEFDAVIVEYEKLQDKIESI